MLRTTWPNEGQPARSTFEVKFGDLKILRSYELEEREDKEQLLQVYTRSCHGRVEYRDNPVDRPMSRYVCLSPYCGTHQWFQHEIDAMDKYRLQNIFYSIFATPWEDLGAWPIKLCEKTEGNRCFSSTRPCTKEELLESRAKQLLEFRESEARR